MGCVPIRGSAGHAYVTGYVTSGSHGAFYGSATVTSSLYATCVHGLLAHDKSVDPRDTRVTEADILDGTTLVEACVEIPS